MIRVTVLFLMALVVFSRCDAQTHTDSSICVDNATEMEEVCFVPFFRLASRSEEFDGKLIAISGFLVRNSENTFSLFYSSEAAKWQDGSEAIFIYEADDLEIRGNPSSGDRVRVLGRFARHRNDRLGRIEDVRLIYKETSPE